VTRITARLRAIEDDTSVTTPTNPEQLLRRPKKPQANRPSFDWRLPAAGSGIVVAIVAVVAFVMLGHSKMAANVPAIASVAVATPYVALPHVQIVAPASAKHHHPGKTPAANPSPSPGASPSPTPSPTSTPATTDTRSAAQIAKAKHAAALRLAALRRAQADANGNLSNTTASDSNQNSTQLAAVHSAVTPAPQPTAPPATPTPDAQPTPVYAPSVVVDARFVDKISPVYPDMAREQGAQGTAILLATVGPKGNVLSVEVEQSTGNHLLDDAAMTAARSSKFEPPEIDGKPATETYRIVYTFDANQ
jgi:periplasmic protein TonB